MSVRTAAAMDAWAAAGDRCSMLVIQAVAGSLDATLECDNAAGIAAAIAAAPAATDNCDATPTLNLVSDVTTPGNCPGTYSVTRTWTANDGCGNATNRSQVITVIDTTAPVITVPADITVEQATAAGTVVMVASGTESATTH